MRLFGIVLAFVLTLAVTGAKWPETESGGANVPGLTGTRGNDLTLDVLMRQTGFDALPAFPRFYFSADANTGCTPSAEGTCLPAGADTNACTMADPCLSIAKAFDLLQRGDVIVVFDSLDEWDDAADWNSFAGGSVTRACGTGSAGTFTDEPCGFWIASDPHDQAVLSCESFDFSGDELFDFNVSTGSSSGYFGFAGIRTENCPRAPKTDSDTQAAVFETEDVGLVFVNVYCDGLVGIEGHCISSPTGINSVLINSGFRHRPASDFDEGAACLPTGTCCSTTDTPYSGCTVDATSQYEGNAHGVEMGGTTSGRSGYLVIGGDYLIETDQIVDGGHNAILSPFVWEPSAAPGYDIALIGVTTRGPAEVSRAAGTGDSTRCFGQINLASSGSTHMNVTVARSACFGWPAWTDWSSRPSGLQILNFDGSVANTVTGVFFQNTFKDVYTGIDIGAQFAGDEVELTLECNLFDGIRTASSLAYALSDAAGNAGRIILNGDATNVYDAVSGSFSVFRIGANATTAAAVANCTGAGCTGDSCTSDTSEPCIDPTDTWFGNDGANELDGATVNGDAFGNLADQAACEEDEECFETCDGTTRVIDFPTNAWVPRAVVGSQIKSLNLGTHFKHAGAR